MTATNICIARAQAEGSENITWEWSAVGSHLGKCIAILEAVKATLPVDFNAAVQQEGKMQICVTCSDNEYVEFTAKNITYLEALEGILDVQHQMQMQWF